MPAWREALRRPILTNANRRVRPGLPSTTQANYDATHVKTWSSVRRPVP